MSEPPIVFRTDEAVRITCGGRVVRGSVMLGSANGKSLMLAFEAVLQPKPGAGGYAGMMPVLWCDETNRFEDLLCRELVYIDRVP